MPENTLKNAFGGTFVEQLAKQPTEQWVGPIESGFGLHLVKIANNTPEHLAPFSDIKDYVLEQYKYYAVIDSQQKMFETLLKKYRVRLEADTIPTEIGKSLPHYENESILFFAINMGKFRVCT